MQEFLAWAKEYYRPKSLAFWGGVILIASGVIQAAGETIPGLSVWVRPLIDAYFGAMGPVAKISLGMGILGIRRRLPDA
jgi:hypothetical protein